MRAKKRENRWNAVSRCVCVCVCVYVYANANYIPRAEKTAYAPQLYDGSVCMANAR